MRAPIPFALAIRFNLAVLLAFLYLATMATSEILRDISGDFSQATDGNVEGSLPLVYGVHLTPLESTPADTGLLNAINAIPPIGATATFGGRTYTLRKKRPKRITAQYYQIDTDWDTKAPQTQGDENTNTNPESWSPKWLGSSVEKLPRVARKDAAGNAILLSNGQLYSEPVMASVIILVVRYRKYCATSAADSILLAQNDKLNSGDYRSQTKWKWLLSVSATPTTVNGYSVAELSYELRFNPLEWVEERLQHGSYYLDGGQKKLFRTVPEGEPTTGNLTTAGAQNTGAAQYIKYRINGEMNYGSLGF